METFIQVVLCWLMLSYFVKNMLWPIIEFFFEKVDDYDEQINYTI